MRLFNEDMQPGEPLFDYLCLDLVDSLGNAKQLLGQFEFRLPGDAHEVHLRGQNLWVFRWHDQFGVEAHPAEDAVGVGLQQQVVGAIVVVLDCLVHDDQQVLVRDAVAVFFVFEVTQNFCEHIRLVGLHKLVLKQPFDE